MGLLFAAVAAAVAAEAVAALGRGCMVTTCGVALALVAVAAACDVVAPVIAPRVNERTFVAVDRRPLKVLTEAAAETAGASMWSRPG